MKITVQITATAQGATGTNPTALTWTTAYATGDNPRMYGDAIQRAIEQASLNAQQHVESFVDYRDTLPPTPTQP